MIIIPLEPSLELNMGKNEASQENYEKPVDEHYSNLD